MEGEGNKNVNSGSVSAGRDSIFGDQHTHNYSHADDLILRIQKYLDMPDIGLHFRKLFLEWMDELKVTGNKHAPEIRHKFTQEEGKLLEVARSKNHKLKIWLDRYEQKEHFIKCLKQFGKYKQCGAFVFCIVGNSENDGIEDATEMLQLHYFNKAAVDGENVKEKRINDSVSIKTKEDAQSAYEDILRELLNLDLFSELDDFMEALQNKKVVTRCKIRSWEEEGLSEFFNMWLQNISREHPYHFVLLFEFSDDDFEKLQQIIDTKFCNTLVAVLPKLDKVIANDVHDFFATPIKLENQDLSYDTIFDRNSLTSKDTPLYYREAINKLQLK